MSRKRRTFSAKKKAKIALLALEEILKADGFETDLLPPLYSL